MRKSIWLATVLFLVIGVGVAGCSSKPKTEAEARQYVVGTWQCKQDNDFVGKTVTTLEIRQDGSYSTTMKFRDKPAEKIESGTWKIDSFVDYLGPGKPVEDTYKIVFESSNPAKSGALRDGEIQAAWGDFKKKH